MKDFLTWAIAIIIAIAIMIYATGYHNDAAARRAQAAAMFIREQSQARLDLAAAAWPYFALTVVVIVTVPTAGLIVYALARSPRPQPATRIIETRTIILLQPGQSARQFWRQLSQSADIKMIGGNRDDLL